MLPTTYQQFIHLSRYSRWDDSQDRRENWEETVARYFGFFVPHLNAEHNAQITDLERIELAESIYNLDVLPSMRCLMTAGPALSRDHIAGYNCAYRPINDIRAFDEILFILMCSTGVGFSVERRYVEQLPVVADKLTDSSITIGVRDSKRGWAEAYRELLGLLYAGRIPSWDTSKLRLKGARLKTMGGTASGPEPLIELFKFTVKMFMEAEGKRLTSQQCHDLVCMIGECVVVGGVRRSALLSLSDLDDSTMRDAKAGEWYKLTPWRRISNNSVAYTEKPTVPDFMREWFALYESKSGERGIFNREAARKQAMKSGRRKGYFGNGSSLTNPPHPGSYPIDFGTNPCSEILLRAMQFCNLSSIVIRPGDNVEAMVEKVRSATILGTWQASLTNFRYISSKWRENCEEERLLGVSMTGIMDNVITAGQRPGDKKRLPEVLEFLKSVMIDTNLEWSERLSINQTAAGSCVKPEGTGSQLVGSSSGLSPAWGKRFIRRTREDVDGPLTQMLLANGHPMEKDIHNAQNYVVDWPVAAPVGAVTRDQINAKEQLEHWKVYQDHWCEHKPSITVYVREEEWPSVGGWVYDNFDSMSGVSFLPHNDHIYKQAPYEDVGARQYNELVEQTANIDWDELQDYEQTDQTTSSHELACTGGVCEL